MSSENDRIAAGIGPAVKIGRRRRCRTCRHFRLNERAMGVAAANDCFMSDRPSIDCEPEQLPLRQNDAVRRHANEKPLKNPRVKPHSHFIQQPKKF